MKKNLLIAAALLSLPTLASAQIGVSISIGEPGFYGRIDIGNTLRTSEAAIVERQHRVALCR